MQRFKKILFVMNPEIGNTAALKKAASLARQNNARLTLCSVVEKTSDLSVYTEPVAERLLAPMLFDQRKRVQRLMVPLREEGLDVGTIVVAGITFLEIIRLVLREKFDLVVMAAEEHKGIRARVFGTTSMHLMRKCPCPVWVVKRTQTRPYSRILAAVDPSAYDPTRDSLNPLIQQLASSMARKEAGQLHVIHVWQMIGERYVRNRGMSENDVQEARALEKMHHKQRFDTLLRQVDIADLKPCLHLIEGIPDERIPELVAAQGIDLLVMGTVSRTGIAGFLIGNTAEEVLNQVDCSVLTVKPEGFVTPVTLE